MFINDVGQNTWEEIDEGAAGANYGWPTTEGPTTDPRFRSPVLRLPARHRHAYRAARSPAARSTARSPRSSRPTTPATTSSPTTAAAGSTGSTRRSVGRTRHPGLRDRHRRPGRPARGRRRQPVLPCARERLEHGHPGADYLQRQPVADDHDPAVERDGVGRAVGDVHRVRVRQRAALVPVAAQHASTSPGATGAELHARERATGRQRRQFRCVVTNGAGSATSASATLTVIANVPPVPAIVAPAEGTLYTGGQTIVYSGTATDAEDGALPAVRVHLDGRLPPRHPHPSGPRAGQRGDRRAPSSSRRPARRRPMSGTA